MLLLLLVSLMGVIAIIVNPEWGDLAKEKLGLSTKPGKSSVPGLEEVDFAFGIAVHHPAVHNSPAIAKGKQGID